MRRNKRYWNIEFWMLSERGGVEKRCNEQNEQNDK